MSKVLYRYEIQYKNFDGDPTSIELREYRIIKETDRSYCIRPYFRDKWIRKNTYNAFAHTTTQDAKDHFIRRTNKRIGWYKFWLEECQRALELIKE